MRIVLSVLACLLLASCAGVREPRVARHWLARVQNEDGSWGNVEKDKHLLTSISLLSFLARGETPVSEIYGATVQRAMIWLVNNADSVPEQADDPDYQFLPADAIVAKVLADSYAMTKIPFLKKPAEEVIKKLLKQKRDSLWHHETYRTAYMAGIVVDGLELEVERRTDNVRLLKVPSHLKPHQVAKTAHEVVSYGAERKTASAWAGALLKGVPSADWEDPSDQWPLITWWFTNWTYEKLWNILTDMQKSQRKKWLNDFHTAAGENYDEDGALAMPGDPKKPTKEASRFKNKSDARIYASAMVGSTKWPTRRLPTFRTEDLKRLLEKSDSGEGEGGIVIEIE